MRSPRRVTRAAARGLGGLASAALMLLAFPPVEAGWLIPIALVPALCAVRGMRLGAALLTGPMLMLLVGTVHDRGWLAPPILDHELPRAATAACTLFGLGLMAPLVLASRRPWTIRLVATVSVAGVCSEGLLLLVLPGHLALALARQPVALSIAAVGGIWTVSLLVWWTNAALAALLATGAPRFAWAAAAVVPVAGSIALLHVAASARNAGDEHPVGSVRVVAVQQQEADLETWRALHRTASTVVEDGTPAMVVWPELSAVRIAPDGGTASLQALAREQRCAPFVAGFRDATAPLPHNVCAVFSAEGESTRYFKRHPFADERHVHRAGRDPVTVEIGGVRYGLAICFDSCFPATMKASARRSIGGRDDAGRRPQVLLLPTLDPPDHAGFIQALHAAFTPFRAAETGLPIVRADITSRSMIVDGRGRILAEAGEGTAEIIAAAVPLGARPPLAMQVGDGVLLLCIVGLLLLLPAGRTRPTEGPGPAPT